MNFSMRSVPKVVTNSCCFLVSTLNSSVSQGNKEPCIVSHVCDMVSSNLLVYFLEAPFIIHEQIIFSYFATQSMCQFASMGFASSLSYLTN
jgi:hypothetical protein